MTSPATLRDATNGTGQPMLEGRSFYCFEFPAHSAISQLQPDGEKAAGLSSPMLSSQWSGQQSPHAAIEASANAGSGKRRIKLDPRDRLDYRLIYSVSFSIFLLSAVMQRLLPRHLRSFPCDPSTPRGPIAEAHLATRTIMPFAFMG